MHFVELITIPPPARSAPTGAGGVRLGSGPCSVALDRGYSRCVSDDVGEVHERNELELSFADGGDVAVRTAYARKLADGPEIMMIVGIDGDRAVVTPALPACRRRTKKGTVVIVAGQADLQQVFVSLGQAAQPVDHKFSGQEADIAIGQTITVEVCGLRPGAVVANHCLAEFIDRY